MLTRIARAVAVTAACLLGAFGVVLIAFSPSGFCALAVVVLFVGALPAIYVQQDHHRRGVPPARKIEPAGAARAGAVAAAATSAALLVAAGIVGLLGTAAGLVIPLLLAATGLWMWRNRGVIETCFDAAATTPTPPAAGATTPTTPQFTSITPIDPCLLSIPQLCLAWHRSYWLLHDLPAGLARGDMVSRRERLLDELERRDPVGFHRWLHSGASPSSDPGRYLTGTHTDTGGDQTTPTP